MPVFTGSKFTDADLLTAGLSRVMFPIVVLLALNGLVVGILNAHDHFSIPAIAPLVWNVAIIAGLVGLRGLFDGRETLRLRDRRPDRHRQSSSGWCIPHAARRLPAQTQLQLAHPGSSAS